MSIFTPDLIIHGWKTIPNKNQFDPSITEKQQCLQSIVKLLESKNIISDYNTIYNKLVERENAMSTGIGNQIAIPHVRDEAIRSFRAVVYLLDKEMDFNSIDNKKVKLVSCFVIPINNKSGYIKVLSKVSEFFRNPDNRSQVFNEKTKEGLYKIFRRLEDEIQV